MVLLVLYAPFSTNVDSLQVLSIVAPIQDRVYARGYSKFVAVFAHLVIGTDDECDLEYVPPSTATPSQATRAARDTPKKVATCVVTASQSDEERTQTSTPSGSASNEEELLAPKEFRGWRKPPNLLRFPHTPLL